LQITIDRQCQHKCLKWNVIIAMQGYFYCMLFSWIPFWRYEFLWIRKWKTKGLTYCFNGSNLVIIYICSEYIKSKKSSLSKILFIFLENLQSFDNISHVLCTKVISKLFLVFKLNARPSCRNSIIWLNKEKINPKMLRTRFLYS